MKIHLVLSTALVFSIVLVNAQETKTEAHKKGINLHLYAVPSISFFNFDKVKSIAGFSELPGKTTTLNVGAGFTQSFGERFAFGSDYYYGRGEFKKNNYNYESRIFETPIFIQYSIVKGKRFSLTPQVGVNLGKITLQSTNKSSPQLSLNSTSLKQSYTMGRTGLTVEYNLTDILVLAVKAGYDFSISSKSWETASGHLDTNVKDDLSHLYFGITVGTRVNLNNH